MVITMQFSAFGEYLFSLLFAPLKKGERAVNQFFIFSRVVGREFDEIKAAAFRVRDEANLASASPAMLSVHGLDRELPRLAGESDEDYRLRLMMKAVIAGKAGTTEGIRLAVVALGYPAAEVIPRYLDDPDRWAEAVVRTEFARDTSLPKRRLIISEANKVKPASAKLILNSYEVSRTGIRIESGVTCLVVRTQHSGYLSNPVRFDGSACFDGARTFYQEAAMQSGIHSVRFTFSVDNPLIASAHLTADRRWTLDGSYSFSGNKKFNGALTTEEL